jgi:hypothetical protein
VEEADELGEGKDEGVAAGRSGVLAVVEEDVTGAVGDAHAGAFVVACAGFPCAT